VLERTNARGLDPTRLAYTPELAVIDVSFISLRKVLQPVVSCLTPTHEVLALVKPQFEVGRERLGKGGVVRSGEDRRAALTDVGLTAMELGESVLGFFSSGLPGPKGNRETFIWLAHPGHPAAVSEQGLRDIARLAEP
jgi:23S rRNA (cytidine1920-2'-O)/16S rRNA (cytidine1409-2'-O)-methyltransferase